MTDDTLIAPDVAKLIQLFSAQPDLRFPDLDAGVLHDAAARVKERHLELVKAEAMLAAARTALEEEQELLLKKSQRAHAYLSVFAENDEVLSEKVAAISLPRPRRSPRVEVAAAVEGAPEPKKRGRPRKLQVTEAATLFSGDAA